MKYLLAAVVALTLGAAVSTPAAAGVISSSLPAGSYSDSSDWNGYTAQTAFNGGSWNSGTWGTQWIQVDLGSVQSIAGLSLVINQAPNGWSWDEIYVSSTSIGANYGALAAVDSRSSSVNHGDLINFNFNTTGRYVEIVANGGQSWTALGDVKVLGPDGQVPEPASLALALAGLVAVGCAGQRRRA